MVDKPRGFAWSDERRCRMRNRALVVVAALVASVGALLPRADPADAAGKKIFLDSKGSDADLATIVSWLQPQ
jgi:hypothetical protein